MSNKIAKPKEHSQFPKRHWKILYEQEIKDLDKELTDWANLAEYGSFLDVAEDCFLSSHTDGYELAKEIEDDLDNEPDSALVEILEDVDYKKASAFRRAVAFWWKVYEQPLPSVGIRIESVPGVITELRIGDAQVLVQEDGKPNTQKRIVNFEDLTI